MKAASNPSSMRAWLRPSTHRCRRLCRRAAHAGIRRPIRRRSRCRWPRTIVSISARRGKPAVPHRLRARLAERLHKVGQPRIGHQREVRAGVPRVNLGASAPLQQHDGLAGPRQQVRRRQSGDAAAHYHDICIFIAVELREGRHGSGIGPIRQGICRCARTVSHVFIASGAPHHMDHMRQRRLADCLARAHRHVFFVPPRTVAIVSGVWPSECAIGVPAHAECDERPAPPVAGHLTRPLPRRFHQRACSVRCRCHDVPPSTSNSCQTRATAFHRPHRVAMYLGGSRSEQYGRNGETQLKNLDSETGVPLASDEACGTKAASTDRNLLGCARVSCRRRLAAEWL